MGIYCIAGPDDNSVSASLVSLMFQEKLGYLCVRPAVLCKEAGNFSICASGEQKISSGV